MKNLSDKLLELLDRAVAEKSDEAAGLFVRELIEENYQYYEVIAWLTLRDQHKCYAEDVVQDLFFKLLEGGYKELEKLQKKAPYIGMELRFRAWRGAKNFDRKKILRQSKLLDPQDAKNELILGGSSADSGFESMDIINVISRYLGPLEIQVAMAFANGNSHREISEQLEISEGNSRGILFKLRTRIKNWRDLGLL